jgi:hypothetical protein
VTRPILELQACEIQLARAKLLRTVEKLEHGAEIMLIGSPSLPDNPMAMLSRFEVERPPCKLIPTVVRVLEREVNRFDARQVVEIE